jgi:type IV pilus assembly protein PilO
VSRRLKFIAAGVGLLAIIALAWMLLLNPLREDIATVAANIETEKTNLATALAELAQAETTQAEGKENQARLLELAKMVPISEEIPSLMLQIQDLADQSGIAFMSVTPGEPTAYPGYQIIPLTLEFAGTYFDMSDFVWRAEQLVAGPGRLLAVKQIDLQYGGDLDAAAEGNTSPQLQVGMVMYAFQTGGATLTAAAMPVESPPSETVNDEATTEGAESGS